MPLLRRRTAEPTVEAQPGPASADPGAGKGRPTPKRRDAQRARRHPVAVPTTRKEAAAQSRQSRREARRALMSGDESKLPPRDAGPVKRYTRDIVDARRNLGSYFLLVAVFVVLLSSVRAGWAQTMTLVAYPALFVALILDSSWLARTVRRRVAARFGPAEARGLSGYAIMRSLQMRRMRLPPPKVKLGQKV